MSIWTLLLPIEIAVLVVLLSYLIRMERRAFFLKRQEKRQEEARELGDLEA